jgi:dCTP deaminase
MTRWPEGVLPRQALREFIEAGYIASDAEIPDKNLQPASIDLTLGPVAYRLRSSFLPSSGTVRDKLQDYFMGDLDLTAHT